jgi:hypothetical protein
LSRGHVKKFDSQAPRRSQIIISHV